MKGERSNERSASNLDHLGGRLRDDGKRWMATPSRELSRRILHRVGEARIQSPEGSGRSAVKVAARLALAVLALAILLLAERVARFTTSQVVVQREPRVDLPAPQANETRSGFNWPIVADSVQAKLLASPEDPLLAEVRALARVGDRLLSDAVHRLPPFLRPDPPSNESPNESPPSDAR